ncbi:Hypothetical protein HDN1F_00740 [gamma proteobacterium HdN1]|nr:Hypothetical protein HDN1F_00740 [gamma proteobacterium HdN1]
MHCSALRRMHILTITFERIGSLSTAASGMAWLARSSLATSLALGFVAPNAFAEGVRWNGYLNVVGGALQKEPASARQDRRPPSYANYSTDFVMDNETSAGMQAMYAIDAKTAVTLQLQANSSQDHYETELRWLYATWIPTEHSSFRIGRIGAPIYLYSDSLNVGYSYHWIRPPRDVHDYDLPLTGVDYIYQSVYGNSEWSAELAYGSDEQFVAATHGELTMRNVLGAVFTYSYDSWLTLRAAIFQAEISLASEVLSSDNLIDRGFDYAVRSGQLDAASAQALKEQLAPSMAPMIDQALQVEDKRWHYRDLAAKIDRERWFAIAEWSTFRTDTYMFGNVTAWYASAGWRQNQFTWHATYSRYRQDIKAAVLDDYYAVLPESPTPSQIAEFYGRQIRAKPPAATASHWRTVTIGMGIDITSGTVVKFELLRFTRDPTVREETGAIGSNMLFRTALNVAF